MGRNGFSHLINVGTGNSKVINIGVDDWGNVETKKLNRVGDILTCTLRDPYRGVKRGGGKVVQATG